VDLNKRSIMVISHQAQPTTNSAIAPSNLIGNQSISTPTSPSSITVMGPLAITASHHDSSLNPSSAHPLATAASHQSVTNPLNEVATSNWTWLHLCG
jgi:hypothetical protein